MPVIFNNPRARFFDRDTRGLAFGRITFYEPNTTTLKKIYTDSSGLTAAPNPNILNNAGQVAEGGLWLGEGKYTIVVERRTGRDANTGEFQYAQEWTLSNFDGASVGGSDSVAFVEKIDDLRNLEIGAYDLAYVANYSDLSESFGFNDKGGGWFRWEENNTNADDAGGYIAPVTNPAEGRFVRLINGTIITPEMWGALPSFGDGPDYSGNLNNMNQWIDGRPFGEYQVQFSRGNYPIGADTTLDMPVIINSGVTFRPTDGTSGNSNLIITRPQDAKLPTDSTVLTYPYAGGGGGPTTTLIISNGNDASFNARPEWWNIKQSFTTGDPEYLAMFSQTTGMTIEWSRGEYFVNNVSELNWSQNNTKHLFTAGSILNFSSTIGVHTFGEFEVDQDTYAFAGDLEGNLEFRKYWGQYKMSWFDIMSEVADNDIDVDKMYDALKCIVRVGGDEAGDDINSLTKVGIVFDKNLVKIISSNDIRNRITFDENVPWDRDFMSVFNTTIEDVSLRIGSTPTEDIPLGHIERVSGAALDGTLYSPTSCFVLENSKIDIGWFGARANPLLELDIADSNGFAFYRAVGCQIASAQGLGTVWITGQGSYYMRATATEATIRKMDQADIDLGYSIGFKDLTTTWISSNGINVNGEEYSIGLFANLEISNSVIASVNLSTMYVDGDLSVNNDSNIACLADDKYTILQGNIQELSIKNSRIAGATPSGKAFVYSGTNRAEIQGNKFEGEGNQLSLINGNYVFIHNNEFRTPNLAVPNAYFNVVAAGSLNICNNTLYGCEPRVFLSDNAVINSNNFWQADLLITDPAYTTIVGNQFRRGTVSSSRIELDTSGSNYTVEGLLIAENNFDTSSTPSGGSFDIVRLVGSFVNSGHRAQIRDNTVGTGYIDKSTEAEIEEIINASITYGNQTIREFLGSSVLSVPLPSSLILQSGNMKIIGTALDDTKLSGVYTSASVATTGSGSICNVGFRSASGYITTLEFKVWWTGATYDLGSATGFTQELYIKVRA